MVSDKDQAIGAAIKSAIRIGRASPGSAEAFFEDFHRTLHQSGFTVVRLGDLQADPRSNPNVFSIKAAHDIAPRAGSIRYEVLACLAKAPMTGFELELETGRPHLTISARLSELARGYYVEPTGETRRTDSGSEAAVYRATEAGLEALR